MLYLVRGLCRYLYGKLEKNNTTKNYRHANVKFQIDGPKIKKFGGRGPLVMRVPTKNRNIYFNLTITISE